jgi:hypothetical protein
MKITFREFLKGVPDERIPYYKDCEVLEWYPISERYWLLLLKIPNPRGGRLEEIVDINVAQVDLKEETNG